MNRSKICPKLLLAVAFFAPWWVPEAKAACSGSSPNRTAANATQAEVQNCLSAAQNGDTINVPAGTSTWSSPIYVTRDVSIIGAGVGKTNITASGDCFQVSLANTIRISGFSFTNCTIHSDGTIAAGKTLRIDHNNFNSNTWVESSFNGGCTTPQIHPTVLVDHNTIRNYRFLTSITNCLRTEGNYQDQAWAKDPPIGSGTEAVYFEDNTLNFDTGANWVDGNSGGRYVARFNTWSGTMPMMEAHSIQGDNRAVQWWEVYKNTVVSGGTWVWAFLRGGSGIAWGNRLPSNAAYGADIVMNNVRSCRDPGGGVGKCDGSSNWDKNTAGLYGYACRDQIGRSKDNSLWSPGQPYAQDLTPAYFFDNYRGTSTPFIYDVNAGETCSGTGGDLESTHIAQNRDYYVQTASFNGTSGVGVGTLAARPSTCTTGVGYWATDQGSWNKSGNGQGNGVLYKCTATNIWTLYYTPYTYPHPLQGGTATPLPSAPTNLVTSVQ